MAYWPDYLRLLVRLIGLAYYGLLAWLFVGYCRLLVLIVDYWSGLFWLTGLIICALLVGLIGMAYCGLLAWLFVWLLQASCAYCRLLVWLIVAYLPDYLRLTGLAYSGLLAWLFVGYCRLLVLIAAYWPGLLWLTSLIICG